MSTTNPGSKPAGSTNSSSAAATVVVTARDIEFSNYNSTTNKWGGAVMTMMVLDAVTEDLQWYDEKVYAVFKNHDDPTDLIQFSAEIDGLDSRVSTTTPMVPSAKYELYKIYGQTSGQEYATTSQFYFQTPGRVWDFANDTVGDEDITLVSDWFNYGEIEDTNGNVYGMTTKDEAIRSALGYNTNFTVNGTELERSQVYRYKLTSMTEGRFVIENTSYGNSGFFAQMPNLTKFDIVSSKIASVGYTPSGSQVVNAVTNVMNGTNITHRFAFPETMEGFFPVGSITANYGYNQPIYIPPRIGGLTKFLQSNSTYNSKVIVPSRCRSYISYSFYIASNVNPIIDWEHMESPPSIQNLSTYIWGYNRPVTIPAAWGIIPENFLWNWTKWAQGSIVIPEGITQVSNRCFTGAQLLNNFSLPSTLTRIGDECFSNNGYGNSSGVSINLEDTAVTSIGNSCFNNDRFVNFELPSTLRTIGNSFMHIAGLPDQTVFDIPEGVTSIGSGFLSSLYVFPSGGSITVNFPSTLTSIGTGTLNGISNLIYFGHGTLTVDLSNVNPSVFPDNDTSGFTWYSQSNNSKITVKVAPGTKEIWEDKYPNNLIPSGSSSLSAYRNIDWEEPTPQYGYVFYKENWSDTEEKYVELQSVAEFESLAFNNYNGTTTVGEDQIVLNTGARDSNTSTIIDQTKTNIITGVRIGTNITSIPANFLRYCKGISNKDVIIPDNVTSLGVRFMYYCTNFNGKVRFSSNITSIPDRTLTQVNSFDQPIVIPEGVTSIGNSFLANAYIFDSSITLPSTLTSIGNEFLFDGMANVAHTFNQTISIPSSVTSIGDSFLYGRVNFNQPITLPSGLTTLGGNFMNICSSFNQPITVPAGVTQLSGFLNWCSSFNSEITILGTLTRISGYFMQGTTSFDRDLNLPCGTNCWFNSDVAFVNMKSMTHTINFNDLQASHIYSPSQIPAFATQDSTAACYTTGIKISGIDSAAIVAMFPDLDGTGTGIDAGYYRHLIRTGTSQPTNPGGK